MVAITVVTSLMAILLIVPGWFWFRRNGSQTVWLLALPMFGMGLWLALAALGIGPQSLGNIIEIFTVAATAVLVAYTKFVLFDKSKAKKYGALVAYAALGIVVVSLRLFMPTLSE